MAVELKVPEVGESITEVQIGEWLKKVGEAVKRDEPVVMIETDKVTVELPSPVDGVISEIKLTAGTNASVGDIVGFVEEGAVASDSGASDSGASDSGSSGQASGQAEGAPAPAAPAKAPSAPTPTAPARSQDSMPRGNEEPRVMPAAQRELAQRGMDASQVTGSGPGGRILKEDVQQARAPEPSAPAPKSAAPAPKPAAPAPRASTSDREQEVVAMSPMRKRIAERLVESQQSAALLTTFNEVDMSEVMAMRKQYQPLFTDKYGIKLGFMSFFVKAACDALKLIPQVNAQISGTDIVYHNYMDIGVAVGGGKGLVVPVIRNAERLSFAEVELTISDFGARAKKNALKLDELQGGTFTISNGGVYGSLMSTPIINPPQSGILGLHGIQDRPVARNGEVVIRPMMYIALTYDHRIIDGREAVTFLKRIKECVEEPSRMLIEV
ncbi:MAG: 2-oxoglutarate dehydrogenase complex dihydrolipoyllysine-residue succinyltransferase [Myxococcales bacterium]|nr:2-oxoglutarate dehydrogenase complex dihydrolipoyllysine-residue succinyltransferase [Myxococcales bacterium]